VVLRPAAESSLQKIIRLIREAQQQKAPAQQFTDNFSAYYTYVVLGLSLLMFFVWWIFLGLNPFQSDGTTRSAFYRTMTLLVVASPAHSCFLFPPQFLRRSPGERATASCSRRCGGGETGPHHNRGVRQNRHVDHGELKVQTIESFPAGRETDIGIVAYSLERLSTHPLARAIGQHAKTHGLEALEVQEFQSNTGTD